MKKKILQMIAVVLCVGMLYGCAATPASEFDVDIGEDYFVATIGNIIEDFDSHIGRTVRIEGAFQVTGAESVYRSVIRRDLSC